MNKNIKEVLEKELTNEEIKDIWFDWFCSEKALINKGKVLINKVKKISSSKKIDLENNFLLFKNNFPMVGKKYDDFRICDIKTRDVIYTIIPESGFKNMDGKGCVWGKENDFKEVLFEGSWKEIIKWFNE